MKKIVIVFVLLLALSACTETTTYTPQLLPGNDAVTIGSQHTDKGCIVITDTETIVMDIVSNNVNTTELGEYEIRYETTIDDEVYKCKRMVKVVDDEAPYVRLEPGVDTIYVGETHIDAGVLASDNLDQELDIEIDNQVDTATAGTYKITYIVSDDYDNITIITRTVTVIANQ